MLTLDLQIEPIPSAIATYQRCQERLTTAYHTAKPYLITAARWTAKGLNILYWTIIYSTAIAYALGMIARDGWEALGDHINAIQDTPENIDTQQQEPDIPDPTTLAEIALCDELIAACQEPDLPNLSDCSTVELRKLCQPRGIKWRNAHGKGKHLTRAEMLEALTHGQV